MEARRVLQARSNTPHISGLAVATCVLSQIQFRSSSSQTIAVSKVCIRDFHPSPSKMDALEPADIGLTWKQKVEADKVNSASSRFFARVTPSSNHRFASAPAFDRTFFGFWPGLLTYNPYPSESLLQSTPARASCMMGA